MKAIMRHLWRHLFLYFFLAVQAIFLAWIIGGATSGSSGPTPHAQALTYCANGGWQGLFTSYADCVTHYANGLNQAGNVGTAIGVGLVIGLWVAADVILGVGRFVVLTTRRHRRRHLADEREPVRS